MLSGKNVRSLCLTANASLREAMQVLDKTSQGVALIVDGEGRLLNTVTDGDIRRAILSGHKLEDELQCILEVKKLGSKHPITALHDSTAEHLRELMLRHVVRQIPLLTENDIVAGLASFNEVFAPSDAPMEAVIMAGGFGKRLLPLTAQMPKPMLPVGGRPLLERTIENLKAAGIAEVNISTHFAAEKIRDHFGDGRDFGVNVNYLSEDKPLGTAGALAQLRHKPCRFLVVNGDILTGVDFRALGHFHEEHEADVTVCVRQYDFEVPYGVMECEGAYVQAVKEKPKYEFFVNAGIYLVEPSALDYIKPESLFHMTDLIDALILAKRKVACFPVLEYWLDIGQPLDYDQAQQDVREGLL